MSRTTVLGLSIMVLVSITGCARPAAGTGSELPAIGTVTGNDPAVFLDQWRDFPVTRKPRPVVLADGKVQEAGYRTDDAKQAVLSGRIRLAVTPPAAPKTLPVQLPDGRYTLATITATQAFEQVRAIGKDTQGKEGVPVLDFTSATLGTAEFRTDRGKLRLPAWLFGTPDALGPVAVPALDPSAVWQPAEVRYPLGPEPGKLAGDGVTLTVQLPWTPESKCPGSPVYENIPVVRESGTAVAVGISQKVVSYVPGSGVNCGSDMMLRFKAYQVTLAAPLGNRVVLDPSGAPLTIIRQ